MTLVPAMVISRRVITDVIDLPLADGSSMISGIHIKYRKLDETGYCVECIDISTSLYIVINTS